MTHCGETGVVNARVWDPDESRGARLARARESSKAYARHVARRKTGNDLVPIDTPPLVPLDYPWHGRPDPATRYLGTLARGSRAAQVNALRTVARLVGAPHPVVLPWHRLSVTEAAALAAKLRERYAPRTVNRILAAVRGVLRACFDEGWLDAPTGEAKRDHLERLYNQLKLKKTRGRKVGRLLVDEELGALWVSCREGGLAGLLDAAILALGAGAGLRREEIAHLSLDDVHLDTGRVDVQHGKGDKARVTFLPPNALRAVADWIQQRGSAPGRLLLDVRGQAPTWQPLTPKRVWERLRDRQHVAGVPPFKPHDLRRTFITRQLRAGSSYGSVQTVVGHESIETTSRYDLTSLDQTRAEVVRVDLPFGR